MNAHQMFRQFTGACRTTPWLAAFTTALVSLWHTSDAAAGPGGVVAGLWDTGSHLESIPAKDRSSWTAVPTDLFSLEKDPPKAASDPGYYGRDYAFKGDAVFENDHLTAFFSSARGRVLLFSKSGSATEPVAELVPNSFKNKNINITHCSVLRNAGDQVVVEAFFAEKSGPETSAIFSFGKSEITEIKNGAKMSGLTVASPIEFGIVPGFIGDDLVYKTADYASADTIAVPSENCLIGLLKGGGSELVVTWPAGKQQVQLNLSTGSDGARRARSLDIQNDGQSVFVSTLSAQDIWHRESFSSSFLEKDQTIQWKRPFPAKWVTQLEEAGVKTTFTFREAKAQIWRGVPGSYSYPVWFDGDAAAYHMSKKVPPRGESLIYFVEGNGTPANISTPADILNATLGRSMADALIDSTGRKLRTHHRRGADGVRRACTCGCTEAIQAIFEAGDETSKQDTIKEQLEDMIYFVERHMERIDEYQKFASELSKFLSSQSGHAVDLKSYMESIEPIVAQIPKEFEVQKENMKSLSYARDLAGQTTFLTSRKDPKNLAAYMDLLKAWRAMGGAQDYVVAQCHAITRKLFQEAGYRCADQPKAVGLAQEVRKRCKIILRNPDGYEIWPNY